MAFDLCLSETPRTRYSAVATDVAVAVAIVVRRSVLATAIEDPEGGAQGCAPFFIGTGMSRMKNPCGGTARAGW